MLGELLSKVPLARAYPNLLVGTESSDDAAVYRLNDEQALIATTDFFLPIVDDPYDFGRIAATNALSDVYAMGGTPMAMASMTAVPRPSALDGCSRMSSPAMAAWISSTKPARNASIPPMG